MSRPHQLKMAAADDLSLHLLPETLPVANLDVKEAFSKLSSEEQKYLHFLSQACWHGSLIVLHQTSAESPAVFDLLHECFSSGVDALRKKVVAEKVASEAEFNAFVTYAASFFANMGNYLGFGDTKFVPRLSKEKFLAIISAAGEHKAHHHKDHSALVDAIFSLDSKQRSLGPPETGTSAYYCPYNTRLFKEDSGKFRLVIAAALKRKGFVYTHEGATIEVVYGDYAPLLQPVADAMVKARNHVSNARQGKMVDEYIKHFLLGDIDDFKAAQVHWVHDKGPVVETNIGFVESYRDPFGSRGEFEGFVAIVNKATSRKFGQLVDGAVGFLKKLPWPAAYEKDAFTRPDFTSLEVATFAGSGIPAGINIPNFDDIRQSEGFKNVSLGNVLSAKLPDEKFTFIRDEDQKVFLAYLQASFEVQVGLHELLGHGSGKMFVESADGKLNFNRELVNPITGAKVASWYKPGQTWDTVFASISSTVEECRAECVGLLLSADKELLTVFGHEGQAADDVSYVNWLSMVRKGIMGLEFYSPEKKQWRQAHMQARFGILNVLLAAGRDFVKVTSTADDVIVELDRTKIASVGVPAMAAFLLKLQVFKSTADLAAMQKLYSEVTDVADKWLGIRKVVLAKKKPRPVFVQAHTVLSDSGAVELREFPASVDGVVNSFVERFRGRHAVF